MEEDLGSIHTGKYADVIALEGDPIADIANVEAVTFVMKNGKIIRHEHTPN